MEIRSTMNLWPRSLTEVTVNSSCLEADASLNTPTSSASALLTPFKRVVLPPPMYSTKIDCPANVSSVSFAPQTYDVGILLANNTIALCGPYDTVNQVKEAADAQNFHQKC